jgi:hypothetical protein
LGVNDKFLELEQGVNHTDLGFDGTRNGAKSRMLATTSKRVM